MSGGEHWRRSGEELLHALTRCEERARRLYVESLELIAGLDSRDAAAVSGYSGLAELLRDVVRLSTAEARRRISHAAAVTEAPLVSGGVVPARLSVVAAALREGVLGSGHVDVITRTLQGLPPHIADADRSAAEHTLVDAAHRFDARTLARFGRRIHAVLDQDGTPPDDRELAEPVNELHLSTRRNGRLALRGEFDPEASALIASALSPLAKPRPTTDTGPDPRSAAERHGDALVEVFRLVADEGALPSEGGEKPHILVTIPLATLRTTHTTRTAAGHDGPTDVQPHCHTSSGGNSRGRAVLDGIGPVDAESARRIACDARTIPVVLGSRSEPLDLGRSSYTVSTALRRALVLRDGGCAFPGCDRSHRWCHSHHIRHWADDGPTEPTNLVLLCGRNHRLIHHSEWECAIVDGRAEFRPPRYVDPDRTPRHNVLHHAVARS